MFLWFLDTICEYSCGYYLYHSRDFFSSVIFIKYSNMFTCILEVPLTFFSALLCLHFDHTSTLFLQCRVLSWCKLWFFTIFLFVCLFLKYHRAQTASVLSSNSLLSNTHKLRPENSLSVLGALLSLNWDTWRWIPFVVCGMWFVDSPEL